MCSRDGKQRAQSHREQRAQSHREQKVQAHREEKAQAHRQRAHTWSTTWSLLRGSHTNREPSRPQDTRYRPLSAREGQEVQKGLCGWSWRTTAPATAAELAR